MTAPLLSYDSPTRPMPTVWLHYVALACGLIPLGIGTVIFVLYLILRMDEVAVLGFITILVGSCVAFVGMVCAGVYLYQARRATPEDGAVARRRGLIDLGIIIADFPIAFAMAWVGLWLMSRVTLAVHNADTVPAEQFRVVLADGLRFDLGTIPPNATRSVTLDEDDYDGEFTAVFTRAGVARQQEVTDAWEGESGDNTVRVSIENGKVKPTGLVDDSEP
jgi:hypothetical protein